MFTPEGYWSWSETVEAASEWTLQIVSASLAPEITIERVDQAPHECRQVLLEKLVSSKKVENQKEARFAMDLMELWLLANFMDTFEAVLCSPEGRTLRCPPLIKAHGDAFDWWLWPLSRDKMENGEANGYFQAHRLGRFHIGDAQARFCAIDFETGSIRLKPNTLSLLNTASYGYFETQDDARRFIDEQIRPIVGWSICWNADEIPETRKELFDSLGFSDFNWSSFDTNEARNQSSAKAGKNILECVMAAFPEGKGNMTWPEVEAIVGYSRRSIVRALKQDGQHSKWASTGQRQ